MPYFVRWLMPKHFQNQFCYKKNKNLRENLANEGHVLYHDLFSSERIAKNLEIALNKVLNIAK